MHCALEPRPLDGDLDNPLDMVEDALICQDWDYTRVDETCLRVETFGAKAHYTLTFNWDDKTGALAMRCRPDMTICKSRLGDAALAINRINNGLWFGHFEIDSATNAPVFRHIALYRGFVESGYEHMEEIIILALNECERHAHLLSLYEREDSELPQGTVGLMLMECAGAA